MTDTEQWLSDGNCDICRRAKYCTKTCKPAGHRQQRKLAHAVMKAVYDIIYKKKESGDQT